MRTIIIFLVCMISSIFALGQNQKQNLLEEIRCTPPRFTGIPGTIPALTEGKYQTINEYLAKNVQYPTEDLEISLQGTEVVQFIVSTSGNLSEIKIVNSLSDKVDAEVIRALKTTEGMWKPGYNDDKPVAMEKEVSVAFRIDGMWNNDFNFWARKYFTQGNEIFFKQSNPRKAIKYFDKGITLLPNDKSLLVMRGIARFQTGNKEGAVRDWSRIKSLGGFESEEYLKNLSDLKGYAELTQIMGK